MANQETPSFVDKLWVITYSFERAVYWYIIVMGIYSGSKFIWHLKL